MPSQPETVDAAATLRANLEALAAGERLGVVDCGAPMGAWLEAEARAVTAGPSEVATERSRRQPAVHRSPAAPRRPEFDAWPRGEVRQVLELVGARDAEALLRRRRRHAGSPWGASLTARLEVARGLLLRPALWILDGTLDCCEPLVANTLLTNVTRSLPDSRLVLVTRHRSLLSRCQALLVRQRGALPSTIDWEVASLRAHTRDA